ncbi:hypothetical protein [Dyella subtropica]|uniref:hypothetical protein n=1 Tax=Dyella subtropica TaxID=2992127 RepID=UPI00225A8461|nr:hypothetical protein [Dyella subtropica]
MIILRARNAVWYGITLSLFSCLLFGCTVSASQVEVAPTPGERFFISQTELPIVEERAARGDVKSINQLVDYYMLYRGDDQQGISWLERLGDAGDVKARKDVMTYYHRHPSEGNARHVKELISRWGL